jgi:hypothetical protein
VTSAASVIAKSMRACSPSGARTRAPSCGAILQQQLMAGVEPARGFRQAVQVARDVEGDQP